MYMSVAPAQGQRTRLSGYPIAIKFEASSGISIGIPGFLAGMRGMRISLGMPFGNLGTSSWGPPQEEPWKLWLGSPPGSAKKMQGLIWQAWEFHLGHLLGKAEARAF